MESRTVIEFVWLRVVSTSFIGAVFISLGFTAIDLVFIFRFFVFRQIIALAESLSRQPST